MSSKASGASNPPNGEARHRTHNDGSSGRAFTVEQKAAVIRVKRCKATAFYDILGLEEVRATCTDTDIKKAYRKLSLLTHPDKNGYDGADEAFKMVSRAFQILSDADKKKKYDTFGGDPESRFGSGGGGPGPSSPFSSFSRANGTPGRSSMFEEDISPEELFRQFFGGGGMGGGGGGFGPFGGGGLFDTGPGFIFNLNGQTFGGPGVRVHQFNGGRPRRRPHGHDASSSTSTSNGSPPSPSQTLASLLPLLLLFLLPLLSSLFSSFTSSSTPAGPSVAFSAAPPHTLAHTSANLAIPYWVDPADVAEYTAPQWRRLDRAAEARYLAGLRSECEAETQARQRLEQEAQGLFWQDAAKMERARRMEMRSCRRLRELSGGYYF